MNKVVVVAGGGVIGLSIARCAAMRGLEVYLLEKNLNVGTETSSRNSEVIHAGIYYRSNTLKAKLCVKGREMLYQFCSDYNVPYEKCGKLIVATTQQQVSQLHAIAKQGQMNGVNDLTFLSKYQVEKIEPQVQCLEALYSPSTGILDSHTLLQTLEADAELHGASIVRGTSVVSGEYNSKHTQFIAKTISESDGSGVLSVINDTYEIPCDYFINTTGIHAPRLMQQISAGQQHKDVIDQVSLPDQYAKGTYFKLLGRSKPFQHLIYPIPEVGGLGVHSTKDLDGNIRFGPDVEWVDEIDYQPHESKMEHFMERIQTYWPEIRNQKITADYCGIRPKILLNKASYDDFYIAGPQHHGVPGIVHLGGIESPGLTSSLAIADYVMDLLAP